jgi:hypothetical protein
MTPQYTFTKPERYIRCPGCNGSDFSVSHLAIGVNTRWSCDKCGCCFRLEVVSHDRVDCEVIQGERTEKTRVTLQSDGPMTIVVEGMRSVDDAAPLPLGDGDEYFYNEHTCPTNYLRVLKVVAPDGDEDPHGIFSYVKTEPWVEKS